ETAKFKKQTLEKEITFLEKDLNFKRNEVNAYVEKMDVDIDVKAKKQYKNVEVPTGEKTFFGKEKTETKKKKTRNEINSKKDKKKNKNVEVPTEEKTFCRKEKTETKKKETSNVIISKKDYKKLVNAAKENEHLKKQVQTFANTDIYKAYDNERKQKEQIKDKHNDLVQRFNTNIRDYN